MAQGVTKTAVRPVGAAGGERQEAPPGRQGGPSLLLWDRWSELVPRLAAGTLLAAFDFDGTLVPIQPTPEQALADDETRAALAALASRPGTTVAVVSGRPVAQLRDLVGTEGVWMVGLHGLELASPSGEVLPAIDLEATAAALAPLRRGAAAIAARHDGVRVEDKGASLALHTRLAAAEDAAAAAASFELAARAVVGFEVLRGKEVVEARPAGTGKGAAMERLRHRAGGEVVLYVGDDTTDEDAFAALAGDDAVTVRVGADRPTAAAFTLASQLEVAELLRRLLCLRSRLG